MRRWLAVLAILILLMPVLSGCAREAKPVDPAPAPGPAPSEVQSIRVLTSPDHPIDHYLDLLIPAFQEQYPQYRVEKVHFSERAELQARVDGKAADLVPITDWIDDSKGLVQDMTTYIQRDRLDLSKYGPGFADLRTDGGIFFLPTTILPSVIMAHADQLQAAGVTLPQAGWTWDQFRAVARQLTSRETQVYGIDSPADFLGQLWLEGKLGARHWNLGEADLRSVLGYVQTLSQTDRSLRPPKPAAGERYFTQYDTEGFLAGKAVMALGTYGPGMFDQMGLKVAMAPVPHHPGFQRVSRATAWAFGIAATTDRPDAAWAFLHFAAGPRGAAILARAGILPLYQDEAVRAAWLESGAPEVTRTFFDTIWHLDFFNSPNARAQAETYFYRREMERALHESLHRVVTGEKDLEGAVALYARRKEESQRRFPLAQR